MNLKKLILPGVVVLLIVAAVVWSALRPVEVESVVVTRGMIRSFVEEEGRTRVVDRYVISAPVAGRMLRVTVKEGERVAAGGLLARMDRLALDARVVEARARIGALEQRLSGVDRRRPKAEEIARSKLLEQVAVKAWEAAGHELERAKATAGQAARDAERARGLAGEGTLSGAEEEDARLADRIAAESLAAAELQVRIREIEKETTTLATKLLEASASDVDWEEEVYRKQMDEIRAGLTVLEDDLSRTRITAPVDGVVLTLFQESEAVLAAGTPILEFGDPAGLQVEADLLSEDAARLTKGMKVIVSGRALGGREVEGRLEKVYPSAFRKISSLGVEQQRVTVIAEFDGETLKLGDRYRVDLKVILEQRENAVLVLEAALFRKDGKWWAFRIEAGRARMVTVKTGIRDGRAELRRADGSVVPVELRVYTEHLNRPLVPGRPNWHRSCSLFGVERADVLIGSEIWGADESVEELLGTERK